MERLAGKACIVTGGAKGLGLNFATAMRAEGANVVIADIVDGSKAAAETGAHFIHTDVSLVEDAEKAVAECMTHFGKVDVLVNGAAVYSTRICGTR